MNVLPELAAAIKQNMRLHGRFLDDAISGLNLDERSAFEEYASYCISNGTSLNRLAESYTTIVQDTIAAQIYFNRHGVYQNSSFAEVEKFVYANPEYMQRYMLGLALTAFLWPNHRALLKFFYKHLPKHASGTYLEIGPGHGYFFLKALRSTSYDRFLAVDVSPKSIQLTRDLCRTLAPECAPRVEFMLADFLTVPLEPASFDAIVMGEVLEHVERPELFMRRLYELSRPGGFVFMTTCVNSPAIDHISLFRTTGEVERLCTEAGFRIADILEAPYVGKTLEDCAREKLAVNLGYSLVRDPT